MLMLLALMPTTSVGDGDLKLSRMTALYQDVCLKAFPNDKAVEAIMLAQKARPLTADEVKVTMREDPARAWELQDGSATVWIEFPPFHACSVRWNTPEVGDLSQYRTIADEYERKTGGFTTAVTPYDADLDGIHIHAVGEQRALQEGGTESLFIFDQHLTDPKTPGGGRNGGGASVRPSICPAGLALAAFKRGKVTCPAYVFEGSRLPSVTN